MALSGSKSSTANVRDMRVAYLKRCAQQEMQQGNYGTAADKYSEAAALLTGGTSSSSASDPALLRLLLSNRSLALLRAGRAREAASEAEAVVTLAPGWPKGHWRRGKALLELNSCPEAVLSFLQAWRLSEPGSAERVECAQQLLSAVTKLTRQQLADHLLDVLQQQSKEGKEFALTGQAGQLMLADMEPARSNRWQQEQELREALFQLVKAADSGGSAGAAGVASDAGGLFPDTPTVAATATRCCKQYHLLLLKCLVHLQQQKQLNGSSSSSSASSSSSGNSGGNASSPSLSPVLSLQLQLLSARLSVKTKRWKEAQLAAAAAEATLRRLALPDKDQLLQLLLDCYSTLGDACFAERPPTAGTANTQLRGSAFQQHQHQHRPADAAKAFLTALQLLPQGPVAASTCPFRQLRSQLQAKLAAAMELLDDRQQAVVWAGSAAAAMTADAELPAAAPAAGGEAAGQQLALMQLGLTQAPQGRQCGSQQQAPLWLATLTISSSSPTVPCSPGPGAAGAAAVSGLSGPDRVLLLSGLARLAGVARLAVSIAAVVTSSRSSSAQGCGSPGNAVQLQPCCLPAVDSITFKVQFAGSCAPAAAAGFAAHCSSIDALSTGWPELQQVLLPPAAVCCSSGGGGGGGGGGEQLLLSKAYRIAAVEVADLHSNSDSDGRGSPQQDSQAKLELLLLPPPPADQHMQLAEVTDKAAGPVIPLPYAHYSLVDEGGAPLERPDKHPFALTRVVYQARDLPGRPVWYEAADGTHRWRQSASEVLVQLLCLPDDIVSAQQLAVALRPYEIRVAHRGTGEVLLSGHLLRGIVPEDSTWTLETAAGSSRDAGRSRHAALPPAAAVKSGSCSGMAPAVAAAAGSSSGDASMAVLAALPSSSSISCRQITTSALQVLPATEPKLLLQLSKMNLELFESPHQPSVSWWPQLFADDAAQLAWDDEAKDYSDLPPALAAAAAAAAAADERQRQEDAQRRAEREHLQALLNRHKRHRCERIRAIKAQLYVKAAAAASAARLSEAGGDSSEPVGSR